MQLYCSHRSSKGKLHLPEVLLEVLVAVLGLSCVATFRVHRLLPLHLSIRASLKVLLHPHRPHLPRKKHLATVAALVGAMARVPVQSQR